MQWRDATVGGRGTTGFKVSWPAAARPDPDAWGVQAGSRAGLPVGVDLPCGRDPELFFSESPRDVELAKEMCRGCRARIGCLAGALERREACGVWGGELLMRGAIVPVKRPRGRPRKTPVAA